MRKNNYTSLVEKVTIKIEKIGIGTKKFDGYIS